ncbi:hypothetical protein HETIRDRAFT_117243 [Heterobasidion irregulare TC 32-1]|uniref:Uncharacterized protein n=1 Tax=Heterobasidion irregulare (strain TC 32-1) TaxID=747525 RepID=W4K1B0_HETIT|nr:uncharacterized protein HETIRDRAFT_117243 [Heterobasidion irregulare TC 32-1]ETW79618.1 hypothetical protein HETIRDRAFT_117243 [Heterobasidion irregulare TC 32-1]
MEGIGDRGGVGDGMERAGVRLRVHCGRSECVRGVILALVRRLAEAGEARDLEAREARDEGLRVLDAAEGGGARGEAGEEGARDGEVVCGERDEVEQGAARGEADGDDEGRDEDLEVGARGEEAEEGVPAHVPAVAGVGVRAEVEVDAADPPAAGGCAGCGGCAEAGKERGDVGVVAEKEDVVEELVCEGVELARGEGEGALGGEGGGEGGVEGAAVLVEDVLGGGVEGVGDEGGVAEDVAQDFGGQECEHDERERWLLWDGTRCLRVRLRVRGRLLSAFPALLSEDRPSARRSLPVAAQLPCPTAPESAGHVNTVNLDDHFLRLLEGYTYWHERFLARAGLTGLNARISMRRPSIHIYQPSGSPKHARSTQPDAVRRLSGPSTAHLADPAETCRTARSGKRDPRLSHSRRRTLRATPRPPVAGRLRLGEGRAAPTIHIPRRPTRFARPHAPRGNLMGAADGAHEVLASSCAADAASCPESQPHFCDPRPTAHGARDPAGNGGVDANTQTRRVLAAQSARISRCRDMQLGRARKLVIDDVGRIHDHGPLLELILVGVDGHAAGIIVSAQLSRSPDRGAMLSHEPPFSQAAPISAYALFGVLVNAIEYSLGAVAPP